MELDAVSIEQKDQQDQLAHLRQHFSLPEGVIYLDGNSLGALPSNVSAVLQNAVEEQWGQSLIKGWNCHNWIDLPSRVGNRIAKLVGADEGTLICADSTSLNVFKVLATAIKLRPDRKVILSDTGNFPTDLYMAQGLKELVSDEIELRLVAPEDVEDALDETVAVMMITEVDYRTGRKHDMKALTQKAHSVGALALWDLCHSAGAFPVHLKEAKADFAVGCSYKYLNGGPGAPAFVYVAPKHQGSSGNPLTGWMGHNAPFAFDLGYAPSVKTDQMRVGTPQVLAMTALNAALDVFDHTTLEALQAKSIELSELFISEIQRRCPGLELASPTDPLKRGSQVSFSHEHGYPIMQALIDRGVIGDFRAPNIIRFGFAPLYLSFADVLKAAEIIEEVIAGNLWDKPQYHQKSKVT
ncbi:Kynureninase [Pseudovibrio axinellae]|uniref:Kynureninase n=1 Tax=Pseudovibrio axinellae TaxID=989403 RepID=A0A165ZRT1_9HYPH|nr:kynureninase [Pseudovibrio axinellae]KZL20212.1 Kynureninase [Pseudovibrio axinellae]SEQ61176.1 Kynureninase [Pseudovibrio axinellae]